MLVSVIVPVYNVRPYLEEALDSALQQTYRNLEILVIDDGSTDGSGDVCDQYALRDERIRVIHQPNRGLSAARNTGLDKMTGQVVAFLDSDDALHPDMIRHMIDTMVRENAEIVVCGHTTAYTTESMTTQSLAHKKVSTFLPARGTLDRICALRARVDGRIPAMAWDKLYREKVWRSIRFPEGHVFEDIDTIYKVIDRSETVCMLDEALYLYRKRPESITMTISVNHIRDLALSFEHLEAFVFERIPEIYSKEHLKQVRIENIKYLITMYAVLPSRTEYDTTEAEEELKRQLTTPEVVRSVAESGFKTRVAWWMIFHCPQVLRRAYPVYHTIRSIEIRLLRR